MSAYVRGSERFDFGSFLFHAERWLEVIERESTVENCGDLESTELKAVDFGAEYAKHRCNQDKILSIMPTCAAWCVLDFDCDSETVRCGWQERSCQQYPSVVVSFKPDRVLSVLSFARVQC